MKGGAAPGLVQAASGDQALPFARSPVIDTSRLPKGIASRLTNVDEAFDDLSRTDFIAAIADFLDRSPARLVVVEAYSNLVMPTCYRGFITDFRHSAERRKKPAAAIKECAEPP